MTVRLGANAKLNQAAYGIRGDLTLVHDGASGGFLHYVCAVEMHGKEFADRHRSRILAGDAYGFACHGCLELLGPKEA